MQIYKQHTDTFDVYKTEVFESADGRKLYILLHGPRNEHGPGNGYIKLSVEEFEHIKNLVDKHAIRQGTQDFANKFDDADDNWAFSY